MAQQIYTFDYPLFYDTKYGNVKVVKKGYIDISFEDIDANKIDSILQEFAENIKYKIKMQYSIDVHGRSCFGKKKWYQSNLQPINLFNFQPYHVVQTFKDDRGRFDFGMDLKINNKVIEEFRQQNENVQ